MKYITDDGYLKISVLEKETYRKFKEYRRNLAFLKMVDYYALTLNIPVMSRNIKGLIHQTEEGYEIHPVMAAEVAQWFDLDICFKVKQELRDLERQQAYQEMMDELYRTGNARI